MSVELKAQWKLMTLISDSQRWPSITHPLLACLEALTLLALLQLPVSLLLVLPRLMFDALVKLLVLVIVIDLLCLLLVLSLVVLV